MRKAILLTASAAALLVPAFASASANLLSNGDFELITGTLGSGYRVVNAGQTDIIDWSVGLTSVDIVSVNSYPAFGAYAIDLAGTPAPGSISQTLSGLSANLYTYSFYGQTNGGTADERTVTVSFGGTSHTFELTNNWAQYSFTAYTSGNQTFDLQTSLTNHTNGNIFIDNAAVVAAPAPGAMLSFAVAAIAGLRRRSKRA